MTPNNDARAQVAREWMRSSKTQVQFCAEKGISTRALREWVRRFGLGDRPEARAKVVIDAAIAQLQALRAALDAEAACQVGDEPHDTDDEQDVGADQDARHAETAEAPPTAPPVVPAVRPSPPRAWRRGGFDWDAEGKEDAAGASGPC